MQSNRMPLLSRDYHKASYLSLLARVIVLCCVTIMNAQKRTRIPYWYMQQLHLCCQSHGRRLVAKQRKRTLPIVRKYRSRPRFSPLHLRTMAKLLHFLSMSLHQYVETFTSSRSLRLKWVRVLRRASDEVKF